VASGWRPARPCHERPWRPIIQHAGQDDRRDDLASSEQLGRRPRRLARRRSRHRAARVVRDEATDQVGAARRHPRRRAGVLDPARPWHPAGTFPHAPSGRDWCARTQRATCRVAYRCTDYGIVREFTVSARARPGLRCPYAAGSSLASASDGNVDTSYRAGAAAPASVIRWGDPARSEPPAVSASPERVFAHVQIRWTGTSLARVGSLTSVLHGAPPAALPRRDSPGWKAVRPRCSSVVVAGVRRRAGRRAVRTPSSLCDCRVGMPHRPGVGRPDRGYPLWGLPGPLASRRRAAVSPASPCRQGDVLCARGPGDPHHPAGRAAWVATRCGDVLGLSLRSRFTVTPNGGLVGG